MGLILVLTVLFAFIGYKVRGNRLLFRAIANKTGVDLQSASDGKKIGSFAVLGFALGVVGVIVLALVSWLWPLLLVAALVIGALFLFSNRR